MPDLAAALPEVSSDGLSYRFPLRDGITYSTGEPIAPDDFRRGLERAIALSEAGDHFGSIEGADACGREPPTCDLSDSIVVDDESVTYRLAYPDAELPFKLAMPWAFPVPADTPMQDQALDPLPATGPYMVTQAGPDGIEIVRNPRFEEWSAAAQPDGFVDRISWRFGQAPGRAFEQLNAGQVDLMYDPPPDDLAPLQAAHPDQVVAWLVPSTLYVGFDVRKPPFDDERVRQAVNFAIDREHIVELLGGPTTFRPSCQVLPPSFQGFAPFCPYTVDPASGVWTRPDLDRAHELIREANAIGQEVTALVHGDAPPPGAVEVMRYVVDVMEDLGLRATLKQFAGDADAYFGTLFDLGSPDHPQIFLSGWLSDYPGAGNFLQPQFGCDGFANTSGVCDPELDAVIDEALNLYATSPGAASRAWVDIEHELVEEAMQAPVTQFVRTHAVSARTENVQVNPQWGILLSRLWVQ